jgi:hypothetical protein
MKPTQQQQPPHCICGTPHTRRCARCNKPLCDLCASGRYCADCAEQVDLWVWEGSGEEKDIRDQN